jgi:glycine betaine/choline ABC-type transport system substrate-binding protein
MRLRVALLLLVSLLLVAGSSLQAVSCVGKTLHIGTLGTPEEQVMAELISQLITERTGTTVKITVYKDSRQIYEAVRKGDVGLFIENPDAAMALLGRPKDANRKNEVEVARKEYRKTYNLIWLEPLSGGAYYSPVLSTDLLSNLPALPKLINKLPTVLNDDAFQKLVNTARGNDKSRKIARDFLKAKKLI